MNVHIQQHPDRENQAKFGEAWIQALVRVTDRALFTEGSGSEKTPRILDVGCGRGELMKELAARGYECHGVDMDPACVERSGRYGKTLESDIESLADRFEPDSFDLVVLSHVLEHVRDPGAALAAAAEISRRWIAIAVPNLAGSLSVAQAMKRNGLRYVNRGHRGGWDPNHLLTFLECSCNLRVVHWEPDRVFVPTGIGLLLHRLRLAGPLETKLLPRLFPRLSNSLVVLCEKVPAVGPGEV